MTSQLLFTGPDKVFQHVADIAPVAHVFLMEIPRRHTQLFAELAGEIIVVAKPALCRDIGDPVGRHQHQQGFFQAELQQILPRRDSGDFRK